MEVYIILALVAVFAMLFVGYWLGGKVKAGAASQMVENLQAQLAQHIENEKRLEQTVQAHLDLRGKWLLPIHNGTFDLAMHAWNEPFERVLALGDARGVNVATPIMGERIDINAPHAGERWWRSVGWTSRMFSPCSFTASPPASCARNATTAASYMRRSFPFGLFRFGSGSATIAG